MANSERPTQATGGAGPATPKNLAEPSAADAPSPEKALSSGYPDLETAQTTTTSQFTAPRKTPKPSAYTAWGADVLTYGWGQPL